MTREEIISRLASGLCKIKYRYITQGAKWHFDMMVTRKRSLIPRKDRIQYRLDPTQDPILTVYSRTERRWLLLFWDELYEVVKVKPAKKLNKW
jgi:hypothetical protein